MKKTIKEVAKNILLVLALIAMGWISYSYRGPMSIEDSSTIGLGTVLVILLILWVSYKIDSLQNKIIDLELKLNQYKNKEKDNTYSPPPDIQKMLAEGKDITETVRNMHNIKPKLKELTEEDFILKQYEWTKTSIYALTEDNILIRYDGNKVGFPFYQCLYEGYWEATDIGISYQDIANAKPISEEQAKEIISKEEKPISSRPPERNNWVS